MNGQQLEKLTDIFRTLFNDPDLVLRDGLVATDVPGWDSFNHVNLMIIIEQEFGVKFTNEEVVKMTLAQEVTFINKGAIIKELDKLSENSTVQIDTRRTRYLDNDIIEVFDDFKIKAKDRNIDVILVSERGKEKNPESYAEFFSRKKIEEFTIGE